MHNHHSDYQSYCRASPKASSKELLAAQAQDSAPLLKRPLGINDDSSAQAITLLLARLARERKAHKRRSKGIIYENIVSLLQNRSGQHDNQLSAKPAKPAPDRPNKNCTPWQTPQRRMRQSRALFSELSTRQLLLITLDERRRRNQKVSKIPCSPLNQSTRNI